jgi:hypothetical protein
VIARRDQRRETRLRRSADAVLARVFDDRDLVFIQVEMFDEHAPMLGHSPAGETYARRFGRVPRLVLGELRLQRAVEMKSLPRKQEGAEEDDVCMVHVFANTPRGV